MRRRLLLVSTLAVSACILIPSLPLRGILFFSGGATTISSARWLDFALLEVRGIRYRDALRIDSLTLRLSPSMLLGRIPEVRLYGARGWLSRLATPGGASQGGAGTLRSLGVGGLTIQKLFLSEFASTST